MRRGIRRSDAGLRSLKSCVAVHEERASMAEARACETADKISKLRALVEGSNRTVVGECACVAELVDAELKPFRSVITVDLSESEGTVREAICDGRDASPVEASSMALGLSADDSSHHSPLLLGV